METVAEHVDADTKFWEVGAWRGYFSLAFASQVAEVVVFEARDHAAAKLCDAKARNDYENLSIVNEIVSSVDDFLPIYGVPDVLLVDIEGWEYDVLAASPELIASKPVLIVELHETSGWIEGNVTNPRGGVENVPSPETVDPEGVIRLLESNGYEVVEICRRRETNYHILAIPSGSS